MEQTISGVESRLSTETIVNPNEIENKTELWETFIAVIFHTTFIGIFFCLFYLNFNTEDKIYAEMYKGLILVSIIVYFKLLSRSGN